MLYLLLIGAGSGIGRATCVCLAREGAIVIAADKNLKNAEETVNCLPQDQKHLPVPLSVENKDSVTKAFNNVIKAYSQPPSIVVNAAGITRDNFISKLSETDFMEVLDVNLKVCKKYLSYVNNIKKEFSFIKLFWLFKEQPFIIRYLNLCYAKPKTINYKEYYK